MKMKNQIKYSFKTLESNYRDIKFDPDIWEAIKKDIKFQLETFHEGITDGEELAQAVEKIIFGNY